MENQQANLYSVVNDITVIDMVSLGLSPPTSITTPKTLFGTNSIFTIKCSLILTTTLLQVE